MSTTEPLLSAGAGGSDVGAVEKSSSKRRRVCIDEALSSYAGEFGRWQLRHFVAVSAAWALEALHTMVIIFADREPATSCAAAGGPCGDPCAAAGAGAAAGWEWAGGAAASTVAEWGLVCGERYKVGLAQSVFFAGCMIVWWGMLKHGHLTLRGAGRRRLKSADDTIADLQRAVCHHDGSDLIRWTVISVLISPLLTAQTLAIMGAVYMCATIMDLLI